jgi:hypothetical protein
MIGATWNMRQQIIISLTKKQAAGNSVNMVEALQNEKSA